MSISDKAMSAETVRVDTVIPTSCSISRAVSTCNSKISQNTFKFRQVLIDKFKSDIVKTISRKKSVLSNNLLGSSNMQRINCFRYMGLKVTINSVCIFDTYFNILQFGSILVLVPQAHQEIKENFISFSITCTSLLSSKLGKEAAEECFLNLLKQLKGFKNITRIYNGTF